MVLEPPPMLLASYAGFSAAEAHRPPPQVHLDHQHYQIHPSVLTKTLAITPIFKQTLQSMMRYVGRRPNHGMDETQSTH